MKASAILIPRALIVSREHPCCYKVLHYITHSNMGTHTGWLPTFLCRAVNAKCQHSRGVFLGIGVHYVSRGDNFKRIL